MWKRLFEFLVPEMFRVQGKLKVIKRLLEHLIRMQEEGFQKMSKELDDLKAAVDAQTTVTQSVVTLLTNLAQQLKDAKDDPVAIEALANTVSANAKSLSDAVVANTPVPPDAPPSA